MAALVCAVFWCFPSNLLKAKYVHSVELKNWSNASSLPKQQVVILLSCGAGTCGHSIS